MKKRLNKRTIIKSFLLVFLPMFVIGLISGGLYFRNRVDNEEGKASEPTYSCAPDARYIDVSMCPTYANYANNPNSNSAVFFNEIIRRAANSRTDNTEEVVIRIPQANFYFFKNPSNPLEEGGINLYGAPNGVYSNFRIEGLDVWNRPTFIDKDQNMEKDYLLLAQGNTNFTLKRIIFKGNSKNRYIRGVIAIYNNSGNVIVHNIDCSGTYRDTNPYVFRANVCLYIREDGNYPPAIKANYVEVLNSQFKSYDVGLATSDIMRINLSYNIFDNTDPCPECVNQHRRGSVSLSSNFTNRDGTSGRSVISNNNFISNGKVDGQTGIAVVGQSNKIDITNNTLNYIQDRVIYVSSHGLAIDPPCHGGPKDITITGNNIRGTGTISMGSSIEAISVVNAPTTIGCAGDIEKATIRNVTIANNTISGIKGGIELLSTPHAPLETLRVYNNTITNSGLVWPKWWFGDANLTGACIRLLGLKGKNNDPNDIKIYNNNLKDCGLGIYFMASYWPMSDDNSGFANYLTQNQKNEYISVYGNTINNSGPLAYTPEAAPNKVDIVMQEQPVKGIGNRNTIVMYNNLITTNPKSTTSDNRCNVSCTSNSECLGTVPTLYGTGTSIVSNYPTGYVCSMGKCRNSANVNDDNCDLNDANASNAVSNPTFSPVDGTYTGAQTVTISTQTTGATIRYTTNGTTPTSTTGTVYTTPITITTTTIIKAIAYKSGMTDSGVVSKTYTQSSTSVVATPTISPTATTFTSSVSVSISTPTTGATIKYTTNGSTPTSTNGTTYTAPFVLSATTTVKAMAYKTGMTDSGVASRSYTKTTAETYCVPYNLNAVFDNRDGVANTLNRVKLKPTEIPGGKLLVAHRETVADFAPNNAANVSKCWGRILNSTNNSVACTSGQVFCAWSTGRAYLRGQDPTYAAGGCKLPLGTYKTEIFLQNSASQTLQSCQSAVFTVISN